MNEHATRARERAKLAEWASDQSIAWAYMFDAVEALAKSARANESERDRHAAMQAIKDACARQFRNAGKPIARDASWIDAAAVHDFNDES